MPPSSESLAGVGLLRLVVQACSGEARGVTSGMRASPAQRLMHFAGGLVCPCKPARNDVMSVPDAKAV